MFLSFSKPENLSIITPSKMKFKILTPSPIEMKEGALIDYTVNIFGFPIRWRTLITDYKAITYVCRSAIKRTIFNVAPYSPFERLNDEETLIKDIVIYAVPFGIIGKLVHSLYIKRDPKCYF